MNKIIIQKSRIKNVFVLEDNIERLTWFRSKFIFTDSFFMTRDSKIAIKELTEVEYDLIFLDHDLDNQVYLDNENENTGYQVAKALKETKNKNKFIIAHTMNPAGASKMLSLKLPNVLWIPYSELVNSVQIVNDTI